MDRELPSPAARADMLEAEEVEGVGLRPRPDGSGQGVLWAHTTTRLPPLVSLDGRFYSSRVCSLLVSDPSRPSGPGSIWVGLNRTQFGRGRQFSWVHGEST
jgi:hypothetical protein